MIQRCICCRGSAPMLRGEAERQNDCRVDGQLAVVKTQTTKRACECQLLLAHVGSAFSAEVRATIMSCCSLQTASNRAGITQKTVQCLFGLPLCAAAPGRRPCLAKKQRAHLK